MQIKPGTILIFTNNVKDLNVDRIREAQARLCMTLYVVIGFNEEKVICYEVLEGSIITFNRKFVLRYFQSL